MKLAAVALASLLLAGPALAQSGPNCDGVPFRVTGDLRNTILLSVVAQAEDPSGVRFGEMIGLCRIGIGATAICGVGVRLDRWGGVREYTLYHGLYAAGGFHLVGSGAASTRFCQKTGMKALIN